MTKIEITDGIFIIKLPGMTAVRIDTSTHVVAVDIVSGEFQPGPDWIVRDLRDGTYGDFHQLADKADCCDQDCAASGQHDQVETTSTTHEAALR